MAHKTIVMIEDDIVRYLHRIRRHFVPARTFEERHLLERLDSVAKAASDD